ncbi:MAG: LptF/LptG family permease [Bacteroidota bacterium]
MKIIDRYIIRKFLGTFFLAITLIMMIVVVFDLSEKMGDFIEKSPPLEAILFDYYKNFIPYFANLFSPLFCFIAVIYFTSRMASRTEIVAILSSGVSFYRLLFPFLLSAFFLSLLSLYLSNFVIPHANLHRIAFEDAYINNPYYNSEINIHRQVSPGTFIYFNSYNTTEDKGYQFSMEKISNGNRYWYLRSDDVRWDSVKNKWTIRNYFIREISGTAEKVRKGETLDTILPFSASDFGERPRSIETMDWKEAQNFIEKEKLRGSQDLEKYRVKVQERFAYPFATIILTIIAVALASRKVRGGIGLHLGLGFGIAFSYILFMQIAINFSIKAGVPALISVWIPNLLYLVLAIYLLRRAPK